MPQFPLSWNVPYSKGQLIHHSGAKWHRAGGGGQAYFQKGSVWLGERGGVEGCRAAVGETIQTMYMKSWRRRTVGMLGKEVWLQQREGRALQGERNQETQFRISRVPWFRSSSASFLVHRNAAVPSLRGTWATAGVCAHERSPPHSAALGVRIPQTGAEDHQLPHPYGTYA